MLLLPVAHLADWRGTDAAAARDRSGEDARSSDYERACAVADYTGVIPVGSSEGLVLGDDPNDATWVALPRGGILVRWVYAPGMEQAEASLASIPRELDWQTAGIFHVTDSPLELLDSAESGTDALADRLRIDLPAGKYEIACADYKPDTDTCLQLVRLLLMQTSGAMSPR